MSSAYTVWCPLVGQSEKDALAVERIAGDEVRHVVQEWARQHDREEPGMTIAVGMPVTVLVRAPDGSISHWCVTGECIPVYWAQEAKP